MKRFYHRTTPKTPPRGCKVYPLFTHMHTTTHSTLYGEIEGILTIHGYLLALNYGNPPAPDHPVTKHIMKLNRLADTFIPRTVRVGYSTVRHQILCSGQKYRIFLGS